MITNTPKKICIGVDQPIRVAIQRRVRPPDSPDEEIGHGISSSVNFVVIEAAIGDPQIITTESTTGLVGTDSSEPPSALFLFHAKKPGTTTVTFTARLHAAAETDGWRDVPDDATKGVQVTVVDCKYLVSVTSGWTVDGDANIRIAGFIDSSELTADANGDYRQLATVSWYAASGSVGDCSSTITAPDTDAGIFIKMDQDGNLTVDIIYDPVTFSVVVDCGGAGGTTPQVMQASPLHLQLPNRGGHDTIEQALSDTPGGATYAVDSLDTHELS